MDLILWDYFRALKKEVKELEEEIEEIKTLMKYIPHGEWRYTVTGYPYCSNCNWMPEEDETLYTNYFCPNCGADMRGVQNE